MRTLALIAVVTALSNPAAAGPAFEVGRQDTFILKYRSVSATDISALKDKNAKLQARLIDAVVTGMWIRTALGPHGEDFLVRFEMRVPNVSMSLDRELLKAQSDHLRSALLLPTVATVSRAGEIKALRFDEAVGSPAQSFVRTLLSNLHYVQPFDGPPRRKWEAKETDSQGPLLARYARSTVNSNLVAAGAVAVLKQKTYLPVKELWHPMIKKESKEVQWKGHVLFGVKDGRVLSADGQEIVNLFVARRHVSYQDNSLELQFNDTAILSKSQLGKMVKRARQWIVTRPAVRLFDERQSKEQAQDIAEQRLGGSSILGLTTRFLLYLLNPIRIRAQTTDLYQRLMGLFVRRPESVALFGPIMETMVPDKSFMLLSGVLGAVGTAEAQLLLCRLIDLRRHEQDPLSQLMMALARVERPTEKSFGFLETLAEDRGDPLRQHLALQGLAGLALMVRDNRPQKARSVVRRILREATGAPADKLAFYLDLLGVSGSTLALDELEKQLKHKEPKVKRGAIEALRWIDHPRAERALIKAMAQSKMHLNRRRAVKSLGERQPSIAMIRAFKKAAVSDDNESVRKAVVNQLESWHWHDTSIAGLMARIARRDKSKLVRLAAKLGLDMIRAQVKSEIGRE